MEVTSNLGKEIKSIRIKHRKRYVVLWIVIILAAVLLTVIGVVKWNKYKKCQDAAMQILLNSSDSYIEELDEIAGDYGLYIYDPYYLKYDDKSNQSAALIAYYIFLEDHSDEGLMWFYYKLFNTRQYCDERVVRELGNEGLLSRIASANDRLAELVKEETGYKMYYFGDCYLYFTSPKDYILKKEAGTGLGYKKYYLVLTVLAALTFVMTLLYVVDKRSLIYSEDTIKVKKWFGRKQQFFSKDIVSVEVSKLKTLTIRGNNIKYRISRVKNADEIKNAILQDIALKQTASSPVSSPSRSNTDDLLRYKELLDKGVITQEEFDAKKKQLLGL